MPTVIGTALRPDQQRCVLAAYVHRFTREHVPNWAREPRPNGQPYRVQFDSDQDWLAHTVFSVTKNGGLAKGAACSSSPTWPEERE